MVLEKKFFLQSASKKKQQQNNNNKHTHEAACYFFHTFFCCFFCVCVCVLRVWRDYENIFRVPGLFILTKTHNNIYDDDDFCRLFIYVFKKK